MKSFLLQFFTCKLAFIQAKRLLKKRITGFFTLFLQKTPYKMPLYSWNDSINIKRTCKTEDEGLAFRMQESKTV